jgi:hypothetical protein
MKLRISSTVALAVIIALAMIPPSVFSQGRSSTNAVGDVQLELIGQVTNFPPTTSIQYGYLSYINGISSVEPIFDPGPQNETTALFTYFKEIENERVIDNGSIRIVNRVGTTTIYLDTSPDGDFANPDSFRDGVPVQISIFRLQVILDTVAGSFNNTFVNTITSSDFFDLGHHNFILGRVGQKFRTTIFGRPNMPSPPGAYLAGYAVGPDLTRILRRKGSS